MFTRAFLLTVILAIFGVEVHAQLPHSFTMVAKGGDLGIVTDVAVAPDGTVFTVDRNRGLSAYRLDGDDFILLGRTPLAGDPYRGSCPNKVMVLSDGTVVVVGLYVGMTAFQFTDGVFSVTAELEMERYVTGKAVDSLDRMYVQRSDLGLFVYRLESGHFVEVFQLEKSFSAAAITPDGTVYCIGQGDEGLRTYHWVHDTLAEQTHTKMQGECLDLAVSDEGTVYVAQGVAGFGVYVPGCTGYSFFKRLQVGYAQRVGVGYDGSVLVACGAYGFRVCRYNGQDLYVAAEDNVGGYASQLTNGPDGKVYVAAGAGGLIAYAYDESGLTRLALTAPGGEANAIAIGNDGTVFLSCERGGLRALRRSADTFTRIGFINDGDLASDVAVGPDRTVYLANQPNTQKDYHGLRAYRFEGSSFLPAGQTPIDAYQLGGARAVTVSYSGHVFLAGGYDGVRAYKHQDTSLICTAWHKTYSSFTTSIAVDSAHNVFFTQNREWYDQTSTVGLFSCRYDGFGFNSFVNEYHNDHRNGVAIGTDHTVFLADGSGGLRAYGWDGNVFRERAHVDHIYVYAVAVASDGTVFAACSSTGLRAFRFTGSELVNTAHIETGEEAVDVALGTDGLVYVAAGFGGVIAYGYSGIVGVDTPEQQQPTSMRLEPAFPNPCRGRTIIPYELDRMAWIRISVNDLLGRCVGVVFEGLQSAGRHTAIFDGSGMQTGTYFYRMETEEGTSDTRMMTVMHY